ncbi:MAG: hypothetical protein GY948_01265 [Alphaproteobacteria bacterium]|nr:hypothetical protein [Alphaproteobacteria bacterium]
MKISRLEELSGVSEVTIRRMEKDFGVPRARSPNVDAVERALVAQGIRFIDDAEVGVARKKYDPN